MTDETSDTQKQSDWWLTLAPVSAVAATAVLCIAYASVAFARIGIAGKQLDVLIFLFGALAVPLACSAAYVGLHGARQTASRWSLVGSLNVWMASAILVGLACLPPILFLRQMDISAWFSIAQLFIKIAFVSHIVLLILTVAFAKRLKPFGDAGAAVRTATFFVAFAAASFSLFRIAPTDSNFNPIASFLLNPTRGWPATVLVVAIFLLIPAIAWLERRVAAYHHSRLALLRTGALVVTILVLPLLFFDLSLYGDPGHYFGYLGPSLHLHHGGTLLVDTFSQYGPGPSLLVWSNLAEGVARLSSMNLQVQLANFLYYAVWLVCLYRMSETKLPALPLGLIAIAVLLGGWVYGIGNLNTTPSVLAFRYLPVLLTVLAISALQPPRRISIWLLLSLAVSAAWSIEAAVACFGIFAAFVILINLKTRSFRAIPIDLLAGLAAIAFVVAAFALKTYIASGMLPEFKVYLQFLVDQNPVALYWATRANFVFSGWIVPLAVAIVVLSDALARLVGKSVLRLSDRQLFYRYVPMTGLLLFQGTYFVGRSVDFTLLIALLPFAAIVIPAIVSLWSPSERARAGLSVWMLRLLPAPFIVWGTVYAVLALANPETPYEFPFNECRLHRRCSLADVEAHFRERLGKQLVLEKTGLPMGDNWFDETGTVRDAIEAIREYGSDKPTATVMLGNIKSFDMDIASDVALMYAGKWHSWPRSVTFSDELVPALVDQIVGAKVKLEAGDLVVVRRDESMFFELEARLLRRVRSEYKVCELPFKSANIFVGRVSDGRACRGATL